MIQKKKIVNILSDLRNLGDIRGSAVVSREGLVISSDLTEELDEDTFAAMSAAMVGAAETASNELSQGELNEIIVDARDGKIIMISAGVDAILVVLAKKTINIGLVLLELGRASGRISNAIGGSK